MDKNGQENDVSAAGDNPRRRPLHIVHIALQGCIKSGDIDYGRTADTGGHIRYLLEQVRALRDAGVVQSVVTRAFIDPDLGHEYAQQSEILMPGVMLHRLRGARSEYLAKEEIHGDLGALTEAMARWLASLPRRPDLIHAHYADAGVLAVALRERLGIPFFFTAHSLGAVKAQCLRTEPAARADLAESLTRRIGAEQTVIDHADGIVASSEDEAHAQYGLYTRSSTRALVCVNPPGCDLQRFQAPADSHRVTASLKRFLAEPEKPILLCLARPVRKKNLIGVIDAYAQDPSLQARANLVIFAGTRGDISAQEPECAEILQAIVDRVEYHDLYGRVAFPKRHLAEDVPAIYQHCARSGGVFINAAFYEPFGLTFIEAAAAGLPVIASRHGGAPEILGRCSNGVLVDPHDGRAITAAAHRLLDDRGLWQRCARAGQLGARYYSWSRYAHQYLRDTSRLVAPRAEPFPNARPAVSGRARFATAPRGLVVTDMDDTLLGDATGLREFADWRLRHPRMCYAVATGRSASAAWDELMRWGAPLPDVLISSVGAEIHWPRADGAGSARIADPRCLDSAWADELASRWQRNACADVLAGCSALMPQPSEAQGRNKLSYTTSEGPEIAAEVRRMLAVAGLDAQVVYSHGCFVDVLAPDGAKGGAAAYVARSLGIAWEHVVGAGNSGNDADLLRRTSRGIAVGNCDADLKRLAPSSTVYFAHAGHGAGLVEGLGYWLGRSSQPAKTG